MKPSTIARITLVILALGFVSAMIITGHSDVVLIFVGGLIFAPAALGLILAALEEFDR